MLAIFVDVEESGFDLNHFAFYWKILQLVWCLGCGNHHKVTEQMKAYVAGFPESLNESESMWVYFGLV